MQYSANNQPYKLTMDQLKKKLGHKMKDGEFYSEAVKQGGRERSLIRHKLDKDTRERK